jgi:hypothetical protein
MALSIAFENEATVGTTPYSFTNDSTTIATQTDDGIYSLFVDVSALDYGDQFEILLYEKVNSGSTQRSHSLGILTCKQPAPFVSGGFLLLHGWDFGAKKLAGTDRSLTSSVRKASGVAISEAVNGSVTIGTTEFSLVNGSTTVATDTTDGVYQLWVDLDAMTGGDRFEWFLREKVAAAGSQLIWSMGSSRDNEPGPLVTPVRQLMHGWDYTGIRLAGSDRAFPRSIRKVA